MPTLTRTKMVTARVPANVQEAAMRLASSRGETLNALIQKAIERELREQDELEFYNSFTLLGHDATQNEVEFALPAQKEVIDDKPASR